jgi:hypothetical protein
MDISFLSLGYFNGYFIWIPRIFHCAFHMDAWGILMDISNKYLGYFIALFIWMPRIFHCAFHMNT